ncbi:MAG: hypothetical protein JW741_03720 [Sedimentisphaerales bacterium]|nr:hypothetical protein [Sedimentisphaerales bacterium]
MQKQVSVRTLTLLVELLTAVVTYQWIGWTRPFASDAVWLADSQTTVQQSHGMEPNVAEQS